MTSDPSQNPFKDNLIKYAGTPDGIPPAELLRNWGPLNKQLAFSNLKKEDCEDIEEILRIRQLKEMSGKRDYELRQMDMAGADQTTIIAKCLTSLGRDGFLIKRATTASYKMESPDTDKKKSRFLGIGAPRQQSQPPAQQPQGGY
ncbi:hypothetical protein FTO70_03860 [Methanosarcina sp. KYL-1]|uniref:hypothetical protein n=1 Tax=Methanosarcina sp. KYL-1 TaxID=2602068 RepID=UPI002101AE2E|nr:hypothetical protein [Methanosarcina sp. KYL-1]MCQ1534839.1 hypothetical protein [Methanosarcina sp. KYL-1]